MYFFYHSGFLSNLRLPWKTEGALKFFAAFDIFFIVQEFWVTCACPEKQRVPWNFSLYLIYLLSFRSFEQLALALKTELPWNFSLCWIYFLHSEFLSNLRLPWKTELPWNFSLCWNIFHYSGFLSNLRLPWKQSLPWNFSSPGGGQLPSPTPRLVRLWLQSSSLLNTANVSSTYRKYANGLLTTLKSFCSWWPTKIFANAGLTGEPMVTPSICRYMLLLKLNSTEEVASCINSTKMSRAKDGFGKTLLL